jgi:hypothetical protein
MLTLICILLIVIAYNTLTEAGKAQVKAFQRIVDGLLLHVLRYGLYVLAFLAALRLVGVFANWSPVGVLTSLLLCLGIYAFRKARNAGTFKYVGIY